MLAKFDSRFKYVGEIPIFKMEDIRDEPMLFACDQEHALSIGGKITKAFIEALPDDWKNNPFIVDSRCHMLMKGMWPCIPGWHVDDVPRDREDGQPNHINPSYQSEHILCNIGSCSMTNFAVGHLELEEPPLGQTIYGIWHPIVQKMIEEGKLELHTVQESKLTHFDWQGWHEGTAAKFNGWRMFIRASRNTNRPYFNERRYQTQVYMPTPYAGW